MQSIIGLLSVAGLVCLYSAAYRVSEAEQALIIQFGNIQGKPVTTPGLHFKLPFVQEVRYFDKRILTWDGEEEQIPTSDKKYIWVDTTARWKIDDAIKFAQTVHNELAARDKLDGVLDGITRDTISNHRLVEAVRNTNGLLEKKVEPTPPPKDEDNPDQEGEVDPITQVVEEQITGEIERIQKGREKLSKVIIDRARSELKAFGIELIDVQLRRISYEKSVEKKVYDRMISERKRIAEKILSIGKGEVAKIQGTLNRDLKEIESGAYKKSQEIKGKADARSIAIYAKPLQRDPSYYDFIRTLEAYKKALPDKGHYIMSTDADFLNLLTKRP